jgi:hypothetical protein
MSAYYRKLGTSRFQELLKSYASAKDNLQAAIAAAVYQAIMLDNSNWLNELWETCGFWGSPIDGKYQVTRDGRQVYAYLTTSQDNGGCGLTAEILSLDRKERKWKLRRERKLAIDQLDKDFLEELLDGMRWDRWGKAKVDKSKKAYNANKSLALIQFRVAEAVSDSGAGLDVDFEKAIEQIEAIREAILAAKSRRATEA